MKTFPLFIMAIGAALLSGWIAAPAQADILYVSNFGAGSIEKFTSAGVGSAFPGNGSSGGLNSPTGLAFDSAGNLYVENKNNFRIQKIASDGSFSTFANMNVGGSGSLAFDNAGNLYAKGSNSTVEWFSPTGSDLGAFASTGLNVPYGLAFDSAGNLYVSNIGNDTIERFSATGTDLGVFASTGLNRPVSLAFDGAGNLYASNFLSHTIEKFSSTGIDLGAFLSFGQNEPLGLAFDSIGNLYVTTNILTTPQVETFSIQKFSPTGTLLGAFTNIALSFPEYLAFTDDAGVPLKLPNQIPEPSAWALLGFGVAALIGARRVRERARPARVRAIF